MNMNKEDKPKGPPLSLGAGGPNPKQESTLSFDEELKQSETRIFEALDRYLEERLNAEREQTMQAFQVVLQAHRNELDSFKTAWEESQKELADLRFNFGQDLKDMVLELVQLRRAINKLKDIIFGSGQPDTDEYGQAVKFSQNDKKPPDDLWTWPTKE
jgi:predicted translin family RNA/ssDNA-binding protein